MHIKQRPVNMWSRITMSLFQVFTSPYPSIERTRIASRICSIGTIEDITTPSLVLKLAYSHLDKSFLILRGWLSVAPSSTKRAGVIKNTIPSNTQCIFHSKEIFSLTSSFSLIICHFNLCKVDCDHLSARHSMAFMTIA